MSSMYCNRKTKFTGFNGMWTQEPLSPQPTCIDVLPFCLSDVFFPFFPGTLKYNWATKRWKQTSKLSFWQLLAKIKSRAWNVIVACWKIFVSARHRDQHSRSYIIFGLEGEGRCSRKRSCMHVESLEVQGSVVRGGGGVVFSFSVDLRVLTADLQTSSVYRWKLFQDLWPAFLKTKWNTLEDR